MQSNESYFLGCLADGVLNNSRTKTRTRDGWRFVDDYLVERFAQIVRATQAKVVLSSSWREGWDDNEIYFQDLRRKLVSYNIPLQDRTGKWRKTRAQEITEYLAQHPEITNYVILDDVPDFSSIGYKNVVLTNDLLGLTEQNVKTAIEILEEK